MKNHHKGVHHITALAGDAQRNADFYVKSLSMRLVKKSVNQDDPGTYHLFYGNASGSPGSGLTFFPWPMARQGKPGVGEAVNVALAVPEDSINYWVEHFGEKIINMGLTPTDVIDRHWFHSVYFQSPGGVLFEIATDGPGYTVDENADKLGGMLILPPWLESRREMIEKRLPEINV